MGRLKDKCLKGVPLVYIEGVDWVPHEGIYAHKGAPL